MNKDFKIIISLAKIGQDNSQDLKFVASIVQYPQDINIDSINKTSEILYKHTDFFNALAKHRIVKNLIVK